MMRALATVPALALAFLLGTGATVAVPGGDLSVLKKGRYVCELPGDPDNPDLFGGKRQPDSDFDVVGDSSYRTKDVRGIYLVTGDSVRFTTGPLKGAHFHRTGTNFLRAVDADGTDGDLRCVNSVQAVALEPSDTSRCKRLSKDPSKVALRRHEDTPAC